MAYLTLTDVIDGKIIPFDDSQEGSLTIFYATDSGEDIQAKLTKTGTATIVYVDGNEWNTLNGSDQLTKIPLGGFYNIEIRLSVETGTGDSGSNDFGVGPGIGLAGQSNNARMSTIGTSVSAGSMTRMYSNSAGTYIEPTGSGARTMLNDIADALSTLGYDSGPVPVLLIQAAVGGTPLLEAHETASEGWWLDNVTAAGDPGALYNDAVKAFNDSGGINYLGWNQGEKDAWNVSNVTYADMYNGLNTVFSRFRSDVTCPASTLKVIVSGLGEWDGAQDDDWMDVLKAEIDICDGINTLYGAQTRDLPTEVDGMHRTEAGHITQGERYAQTVNYDFIGTGNFTYYKGIVASFFNIINPTTTDILLELDGGDDFTPPTGIDIFEVYNGSSWIAATGARQDGSTVRLTHASATVEDVRCLYGCHPSLTNILKDNTSMQLPIITAGSIGIAYLLTVSDGFTMGDSVTGTVEEPQVTSTGGRVLWGHSILKHQYLG